MAITFIRATNIFKAEADTTVSSAGLSDNTTAILVYMAPRTNALTVSPVSQGFTLATTHLGTAGYIYVFHKAITIAANEPATYNINGNPLATDPCSFALLEMDDFNGVDVLDMENVSRAGAATVISPSVTTTENNEICLITGNLSGDVSAIDPAPAGTTNFFSYNAVGGARQVNYHVAWFEQVTAGATGDKDWNYIYSANGWTTATIITFKTLSAPATVTGSLSETLEDAISVASGVITTTGTLAETLEDVTSAASGTIEEQIITGSLSETLEDVTSAASGVITTTGTLASTLENAISVATGTIESTTTGTLQRHFISAGLWSSKAPSPIQALAGYVGVVDPLWGIGEVDPGRPVDWSSEVAGYYYVNRDTGTDSGRTYGTPTAPRSTIPSGLAAGSRVEVAGTYDFIQGGVVKINGYGAETLPVWIVGDQTDRPVFTGAKLAIWGAWVFIDEVDITQTSGNYTIAQISSNTDGFASDHIMIRDSVITGYLAGGSGLAVSGSATTTSTNVIVTGCTSQDLNDPNNVADDDSFGMFIDKYASSVWMLDNIIQRASGSGIGIGDDPNNQILAEDVFVAKNSISDVRQAGLWVKNGKNIVFSQNIIDNVINAAWSPSKAMGGQYWVEGVWYIFNDIFDCRYGFKIASQSTGSTEKWYLIGNKMWNMGQGFDTLSAPSGDWDTFGDTNAISVNSGEDAYIVDNTIYSTISGIHIENSSASANFKISGNIIEEIISTDGYHLDADRSDIAGAVLETNQYFDTTSLVMIAAGTTYTDLAAWQSATSNSVGDQYGDPLFTAPGITATEDFTLQAGSPCVDANTQSEVYALFETTFGIPILFDNAGNARPATSADWDMGALERTV